jgi:dihydroorotase
MDRILEARAFVRGSLSDVEIGIDDEKGQITAVKKILSGAPRERLRGLILLPSGVDWHVHFRDPGATHKEDFATGTRGAALGGIGTVLDMPNTDPVVDRTSRLEEKADHVARRAAVDWGLWATVTPKTPDERDLAHHAVGLKLYLAPTTNSEAAPGDEHILRTLRAAQAAGRWVAVHAEGEARDVQDRSTREHDQRRDAQGETESIRRLAKLAAGLQRIHIAHATTTDAVGAAAEAGFSTGATTHHLLLGHESISDPRGKVNPPLRSQADAKALLAALAAGTVRHVESDHAPHTIDEKSHAFEEAPAGIPGVQTLIPLLLARVKQGELGMAELVRAFAERPALDLGLNAGRIEAGADASFFAIDPKLVERVRATELQSRCQWSPFEGHPAIFPRKHWLRGQLIVEEGHFVGRPGYGERVALR